MNYFSASERRLSRGVDIISPISLNESVIKLENVAENNRKLQIKTIGITSQKLDSLKLKTLGGF